MTATWELCAECDVSIVQFGVNNSVMTTIDGQRVSHMWIAEGKMGYKARPIDGVPWESLKRKLIDDIHLVDASHSTNTRHGIEFVEWQVRASGAKHVFAYGLIEGKEVFAITTAPTEPEDFDIRNAHEFFMRKARPNAND